MRPQREQALIVRRIVDRNVKPVMLTDVATAAIRMASRRPNEGLEAADWQVLKSEKNIVFRKPISRSRVVVQRRFGPKRIH